MSQMAEEYLKILCESGKIVFIVFGAMIFADYLNHITAGRLLKLLKGNRLLGYFVSVILGILPGCAGSFLAVSLYAHGMLSLGAITANMIATSGDESFVMLAQRPDVFLKLNIILFLVAFVTAPIVDMVFRKHSHLCCETPHSSFRLPSDHAPECFPFSPPTRIRLFHPARLIIAVVALLVILLLIFHLGIEETEDYILLGVAIFVFLVCFFTSDTYFSHHILKHIAAQHIWKIALWTIGVLYAIGFLLPDVEQFIKGSPALVMLFAALIGIVPISGPHLAVFFLFKNGALPFSVLLASSIVQDGHGMLPMFASSVKDSLIIKAINLIVGLIVGYAALLLNC
jgi:hypothetical protein